MKRMIITAIIATCSVLNIMASDDDISGAWHGTLKITPQVELKIVFNFKTGEDGKPSVTLDSPDQGAYGIAGEVNFISADSVNVTVSRIGLTFTGRKQDGKLIGKCTQGAMSTDLELSPGIVELKRPQTPKPPYPYTTKEVRFNNLSDDVTLAGTLALPESFNEATPVIVMITGSGLQNRDEELYGHKPFAVIADYLARNGIATLRYDDRGYGESTGDGKNATTEDFARDAKTAMEYLRKEMKFKNVGILGHSEGAAVAFMLGADNNPGLFSNPNFIIAIGAQAVRGDSVLIDQSVLHELVDLCSKLFSFSNKLSVKIASLSVSRKQFHDMCIYVEMLQYLVYHADYGTVGIVCIASAFQNTGIAAFKAE